jgi:hypothetical protein
MWVLIFVLRILEDTEPLLLRLFDLVLSLNLGNRLCFHSSLLLRLGLLLALAKHDSDRVLGLDSMHLHKKAALGDIVEVVGAVLLGFHGLVLFVERNYVLPGDEKVDGLRPEIRDGRYELLVGRIVGVVHEECENTKGEEGSLSKVS